MDPARGLVAGETLVDLFPDGPGDLAAVDGFRHRPGGAPANVAVGLARLAAPPALWTRLGGDPFGDFLGDVLARESVPDDFVEYGEDPTALAVVTPAPDGDRSFTFYEADTATLAFETAAVPDAALESREFVHFGGVALAHEAGREAMLDLAARARGADCTVCFDPNTRLDLWDDPARAGDVLRDALALTDVLCCSPEDLAVLDVDPDRARRDPEATAAALLDAGPHTVFLTRGGDGATVVTDTTDSGHRVARSEPAFDVDVADTTGAGDAFTAAALARFDPGLDAAALRDVLRFANAAAARTTTATGAMAALPDADAVREVLANHTS